MNCRSEIKHKESSNHKRKVVNRFWQDYLCLRAFVLVGEAFLFLFEALNVHHESSNGLQQWFFHFLLDLKNTSKLTTPKSNERSSQKWPTKVHSSIASMHDNGFGSRFLQHKLALNLLPCLQEPLVYIGLKLVTISQLPPKIWPQKGPKIPKKWIKSPQSG